MAASKDLISVLNAPVSEDAASTTIVPVTGVGVGDGVGVALELALCSDDGDEHYPGRLDVTVRYTLTPANEWRIDYRAMTSRTARTLPAERRGPAQRPLPRRVRRRRSVQRRRHRQLRDREHHLHGYLDHQYPESERDDRLAVLG